MRRCVIALALAITAGGAAAQKNFDGPALMRHLEAVERVKQTGGSDEDFGNAMFLGGYVLGIIQAQRNNNLKVTVLAAAQQQGGKLPPEAMRVGIAMAPMLRMPDNLSMDQAFAIVRKYMQAHPEKWHQQPYDLVHDALVDAFPLR